MRTGVGESILFTNTPWWLPLGVGLLGGFALAAGAHWALSNTGKIVKTGARLAPLLA